MLQDACTQTEHPNRKNNNTLNQFLSYELLIPQLPKSYNRLDERQYLPDQKLIPH